MVPDRRVTGLAGLTLNRAGADQRDLLWHLLQLYLHDHSAFATPDDPYGALDAAGQFAYPQFETYWAGDPARRVWLLRYHETPAGFAFLNDWAPSGGPVDWALAEFFVLRKYRRAGFGAAAARALFRLHPGRWELGVNHYNQPALAFWRRALQDVSLSEANEFTADNERWCGSIFRFRA